MQTEFERAREYFAEVHAAVHSYEGEGVIFDALAAAEADALDELIHKPARDLADVRAKIEDYFAVYFSSIPSDAELALSSIAADLDRLFPEHTPKKIKPSTKRSGKGKAL